MGIRRSLSYVRSAAVRHNSPHGCGKYHGAAQARSRDTGAAITASCGPRGVTVQRAEIDALLDAAPRRSSASGCSSVPTSPFALAPPPDSAPISTTGRFRANPALHHQAPPGTSNSAGHRRSSQRCSKPATSPTRCPSSVNSGCRSPRNRRYACESPTPRPPTNPPPRALPPALPSQPSTSTAESSPTTCAAPPPSP